MFNERGLDILQVEVEEYIRKILEEYTKMWVGDRDGDVYSQAGRRPVEVGGEVQRISEFPPGGEPRGEIDNTGYIA
jgi:hypothetical protein